MALRERRCLLDRRFAARGNDGSMFDSRAGGKDRYSICRVAARGSNGFYPDTRILGCSMEGSGRDTRFHLCRFAARGNEDCYRDPRGIEEIEILQHLIPELGLVYTSTLKESESEGPVGDKYPWNEEYPSRDDFIYDSPPIYDEYMDVDWYYWMTGGMSIEDFAYEHAKVIVLASDVFYYCCTNMRLLTKVSISLHEGEVRESEISSIGIKQNHISLHASSSDHVDEITGWMASGDGQITGSTTMGMESEDMVNLNNLNFKFKGIKIGDKSKPKVKIDCLPAYQRDSNLNFKVQDIIGEGGSVLQHLDLVDNPIDPGPIDLSFESNLVEWVLITVDKRQRDVPFDPGGFSLDLKLEDEFF